MNAFSRNETAALIVESNPEARRLLVRALHSVNVSRVWEACNSADALASLELSPVPVDLVVLESALPTAEGTAIVRRLMCRQKPPSFIFLRRAGEATLSATEVAVRARGMTVLGTIDTAATMAGVQRLLKKLVPLSKVMAAPASASFPALSSTAAADAATAAAAPSEGMDVAGFLMKVAERCQGDLLNNHGITCVLDLDGGALAPWRCRILGGIVQAMMVGICNGAGTFNPNASIAVALHRYDDVWILSVAEHGFSTIHRSEGASEFSLARNYARPLNGEWRTRITAEGAITTFRFSVDPQPKYLTPSEMLSTAETDYFRRSGSALGFNGILK